MRIHFISIGGAVMHNMAIALHKKGFKVTGTDDEIYEPACSRLAKYGLLPEQMGWQPSLITKDIDAIILGMHARKDNPEMLRAQELGLKIYSFPEYMYEQTKDKLRIVVGGSHGKTTTTAMILHVLHYHKMEFDFLVGSQLEGFETMVGFSNTSKIAVFEGDEYLTSALDLRPKFHVYQANIGIITGIAWDHINVFPTFENYVWQFEKFIKDIPSDGSIIYCESDPEVKKLLDQTETKCERIPYTTPAFTVTEGKFVISPPPITHLSCHTELVEGSHLPSPISLSFFGTHNL